MAYYDLDKKEREKLRQNLHKKLLDTIQSKDLESLYIFFDNEDTYLRKNAYLSIGIIYDTFLKWRKNILLLLNKALEHSSFRVRQTVVNAAGEIGKKDFENVKGIFDTALFDIHHSPRNAVIGSIKKMGQVNPKPVLTWAKTYLHHPDKEIRREICQGIELRGRTHPEDILPMLKELEFDKTARVRNTLVHVLGQIAYKKGCLEKVLNYLKEWENKALVKDALDEIVDVHERYKNFSALSQTEAIRYIGKNFVD